MKVALNAITLIPKPKCQSKIDNPDNPATQGTQDEDIQNKNNPDNPATQDTQDEDKQNKNTIRVGQH